MVGTSTGIIDSDQDEGEDVEWEEGIFVITPVYNIKEKMYCHFNYGHMDTESHYKHRIFMFKWMYLNFFDTCDFLYCNIYWCIGAILSVNQVMLSSFILDNISLWSSENIGGRGFPKIVQA